MAKKVILSSLIPKLSYIYPSMLSKLQNLPDSSKKKIALAFSTLMTLGVFVLWVFGFSTKFSDVVVQTRSITATAYGGFEEKFQKMYNNLQASFSVLERVNTSTTTSESSTTTSEIQATSTTRILLETTNQEAQ